MEAQCTDGVRADGRGEGQERKKEKEKSTKEKKVKIHTLVQRSDFRDSKRLKSDSLRRGCRLQDGGTVQGQSES